MTPRPAPHPSPRPTPHPRHGSGIGRRALPALALTGASGLLLFALDRPAGTGATAATDTTAAPTVLSTATTTVPSPPTTAAATTGTASSNTTASSSAPTSTVPAAPAAASSQCNTVDGPTVQTKWGPVQVEASVAADGTICSADAIVTPGDRSKSVRINDSAVPVLDQRAVQAQNTSFNGVSGATVTSNGYKQSLQAILDSVTA